MENRLYVGNLPYSMTEDELRQVFEEYGEVASVTVITDRDTGRSKGYGFVVMSSEEEAAAAISGLNGADVKGRTLKVDRARPRDEGRRQDRRPPRRRDDW